MKKNSNRARGTLLIAFLVFAVFLGALLFRKYDTATRTAQHPSAAAPAGTVVVTLFFASPDGKSLVREGREVDIEDGLEERVETVVDELISGPVGSCAPTLPGDLRVLGVKVKGEVAQIDFGNELTEGMHAGSSAEMAAVYSIVDTVTLNFPQIKAVQLLVEGAPVQSLGGHLDLRDPVAPDYTLEKKGQESEKGQS